MEKESDEYERLRSSSRSSVSPELAKKDNFIEMFLDEARLSLHLNHANVVQTFDIGTSDGADFIVMEWVDGINLKGVLDSVKLVETASLRASPHRPRACKGLHHAHRRKTPDGGRSYHCAPRHQAPEPSDQPKER